MKNLISIAVIAALSGAGMAALAQAPTPTPVPTPTPRAIPTPTPTPTQQPAAKQAAPAAIAGSKEAQSELVVLQAMDGNRDGLVSKQEYMTHYEGLYGKIKKDSAGMISLKDFASSPIAAVQ